MFWLRRFDCFSDSAPCCLPVASQVNMVRTAAWDSRAVPTFTDAQPEPHYDLCSPILISQAGDRTEPVYDCSVTHTVLTMTLWHTGKETQLLTTRIALSRMAHSRMRIRDIQDFVPLRGRYRVALTPPTIRLLSIASLQHSLYNTHRLLNG
jgi:hypothetical protein